MTWGWVLKSAVALVVYFGVGGGMTFAGLAWLHLRTRGEESGVPGPELSCGCPKDSRPTYTRLGCDDKRCGEHREQHEHGADRAVTEQTCVINAAGSASWQATAQRPQRRRWDLATAGLAGAVAALLILRAVDRRG